MSQQILSLSQNRRFVGVIEKYGDDFLNDLEKCRKDPYWNLADVGRKYGVSTDRVRQLHKRIYKEPFQPIQNELIREKNAEISCSNDPRNKINFFSKDSPQWKGASAEKEFLFRCQARNLIVEIPCDKCIDLIINKNLVDVKTCHNPTHAPPGAKTFYFRYSLKGEQLKKANFFVCYHPNEDSFFIIPNQWKDKEKRQAIFIADKKSSYHTARNKHWKYQDRYDLLARQHKE